MLGSDGPNVNKKVTRIINSNIKSHRGKGLVEIGSCNIQTVHNAFVKGLQHIGSDISDMIISIYYFFKDWPKRLEDFTDIQINQKLPKHSFIKHCESRWLTLGPAAERLIEQWDGIIYYFEKCIPQHRSELMKTPKYLRIHKVLNEPTVKAEIIFIINSAKIFQKFTLIFQRQEPLIRVLHSELRNLIIVIAGKVCKAEVLKTWNNNTSLFDHHDNLKSLDLIELPIQVSTILSLVSERCKLLFLKSVQAHYISAGKHILNKTSFLHATKIKYFRCLMPTELQVERSCSEVVKISTYLPFEVDPGVLADEWRLLRCESKLQAKIFNNGLGGEMRIDHYWNQFIQIQDSFGNVKYPNICKVVTASLTLSHGSADVERQFSVSGNVITDDKTAMSCRMLNARLNIKSGLQFYQNRPDLMPISKKLMVSAQMARQNYMTYLDKKKKLEQETNQLRQQRENEEIQKQKDLAEVEKTKKGIEHLEGQLKSAVNVQINQKKASDQLLNDGNKRLKKALNKNDAVEAKIAQSMIEAATKLRNEEQENESETNLIQKKIEKRKNCLITNFIKKQKTDKND
ncbi:unnamed protein product [Macrosiphum euphorbiae]|uniref:HAT C-terminal dimerisation domain-containing protein n=1 Tax=Macrosiphum euphorbiae TaxID=13131 RepID=A0AAV0WPU0_9HEMI|nr:unnamed protein product [Macrosiphum euphorbiae]